jgi:hypothetical protein
MYPYISFADYKRPQAPSKYGSIFVTGKRQTVVWGYPASIEHNATILSPLRPSMQKPAEP